jgi:hypothetical protein
MKLALSKVAPSPHLRMETDPESKIPVILCIVHYRQNSLDSSTVYAGFQTVRKSNDVKYTRIFTNAT